ncbi:MAG TPA: pyridoxal-dependent decarboxylase [Solirubrobacteraceae bacterium]|jgi:sphinganine-1-phosphate aldolase|nr:pyridoxal-dependent decarboxylase [Solirubrobacteraceae bacterium]
MDRNPLGLPEHGMRSDALERELHELVRDEIRSHWARAFRGPPDVENVAHFAYDLFRADNGIFSLRTEHMRRIEEAVTNMCVSLFHPPPGASGTFTSGGSESNYSALHAMREWARETRPDVREPEIVAPYSAHPTFSKGCHYFGLKLVRVGLGGDRRASVPQMAQAITPNTIGLVGSAPCWPYGQYDPIDEIGALALEHGLWLHVDACVGGYLAPFVERLGVSLAPWDFRVAAVRSISADLHKYGYCAKPASTVLWRHDDMKRYHYVHPSDWPGGQYSTAGFAGSRPAGSIYAAWAVMRYLGQEGYLRLARDVLDAKRVMMEGINAIPGLRALENDLLPLAFGGSDVDLTLVKGGMGKLGWVLLGAADPPLINLPIDAAITDDVIATFLQDLRQVVAGIHAGAASVREELRY